MTEKDPINTTRELALPTLQYAEGWKEILEAPDTLDYQTWLRDLTDLSQEALLEHEVEWAHDKAAIAAVWQVALEQVADVAIDPEEIGDLTPSEVVETALLTLQANLDGMGWEEEGVIFIVPNIFTGEEARIDLREITAGN